MNYEILAIGMVADELSKQENPQFVVGQIVGSLQMRSILPNTACNWDSVLPDDVLASFGIRAIVPELSVPVENAVPTSVTMRQARLALLAAGLLDQVATAIASLPSPQKEAAQIEWDFSSTVERDRQLVATLATALNLDSAALDQLFVTAKAL